MKMVTGAILCAMAEQAFAHAIGLMGVSTDGWFYGTYVLLPSSFFFFLLGIGTLFVGFAEEKRRQQAEKSTDS